MLLPPNNIAFTECPSPPLTDVAFQCLGTTNWRVLK